MLIDFSDILHINVFTLGQTYLKLVRLLHIPTTTIDPSVYIHRFAKHLEFGKDTMKVASDATRLVSRMNRDWIVQGRRPSGICGACLLLAARMNNYRRSVREVVYVVKVADLTIQKRLEEFKMTKSSSLTVDEFRNLWLEQAHDPPSFGPKVSKKRKRVREVNDDGEVTVEGGTGTAGGSSTGESKGGKEPSSTVEGRPEKRTRFSSAAPPSEPRRDADGFVIPELPIDPALLLQEGPAAITGILLPTPPPTEDSPSTAPTDPEDDPATVRINAIADAAIESEIQNIMSSTDSITAASSLSLDKQAEAQAEKADAALRRQRRSQSIASNASTSADNSQHTQRSPTPSINYRLDEDDDDAGGRGRGGGGERKDLSDNYDSEDDLADVDDWETDSALLTPAETDIKERIWTEMNKEYLKEQEAKKLKAERDARNGVGKNTRKRRGGRRGGGRRGGGGSGGREIAASPAESAKEMLARKTYSKKINYAALDHLFQED